MTRPLPGIVLPVVPGEMVGGGTVEPSCGGRDGYWFCTTHPDDPGLARFKNQFQKDIHISDGRDHRMAWICRDHGPEVP